MATEKLDIMQTIKDGVQYGLKNFFPLLLMVLLYVVTVWIPYLNVGTTIGFYKAIRHSGFSPLAADLYRRSFFVFNTMVPEDADVSTNPYFEFLDR